MFREAVLAAALAKKTAAFLRLGRIPPWPKAGTAAELSGVAARRRPKFEVASKASTS